MTLQHELDQPGMSYLHHRSSVSDILWERLAFVRGLSYRQHEAWRTSDPDPTRVTFRG